MHKAYVLAVAAIFVLTACEGLFTGTRATTQPLVEQEDGSFAPVKLQLTPEMNPIAFNLRGSTLASHTEGQRWNSYRATLSLNGAPIAAGSVNINNTGSSESPEGNAFAHTMLVASVPQAGEYELTIALARPKEITIETPELEVRRNVQPGPK